MLNLFALVDTEKVTNSLNEISPETVESTMENTVVASGFLAALGSFMIFFGIFILVAFIYSLWMFIDAILRKDEEYPNGNGKILWILLILLLGLIPAIIYHITIKNKIPRGGNSTPPAAPKASTPPVKKP